MPDAGFGERFEHRVGHAEPGPQHGHQPDLFRDDLAGRIHQGRGHGHRLELQVERGVEEERAGDGRNQFAKLGRARAHRSQTGEVVLDDRVGRM